MKEAFGGIINIVFVSVFLLIIIGTLGLVVSYTKAFKAKNIIISTIEQYDGYGCMNRSSCPTRTITKNKVSVDEARKTVCDAKLDLPINL